MTPVEWPLRLIPRRSPGVWRSLGVCVLALAVAIAARMLLLGPERGGGLSFTYLPALMLAAIVALTGFEAVLVFATPGKVIAHPVARPAQVAISH